MLGFPSVGLQHRKAFHVELRLSQKGHVAVSTETQGI